MNAVKFTCPKCSTQTPGDWSLCEGYCPFKASPDFDANTYQGYAGKIVALPPDEDQSSDETDYTGREILAAKLIDAWAASKGAPTPWKVAVEITAIITFLDDDEKARLLALE